ncbi:hypothetical protein TsFJ059_001532 [Trichoderma semiorbis]|uniref:Uncharacterized protein n=1 Tax=Trichoderma semiorbis TaxID=1491008 RepID=A0A9P8HP74_9HYPO|nr:hypothetical protein TsFJ059_001532 [Trichoderma semiorbis]
MTQLSALEEYRPRNGSSLSREIESLINYVKQMKFDPYTFVIIVCRHGAIEGLTNKINQKKQDKVFQRLKNFDIRATDEIRVSAVTAAVEKSGLYDNLVIITSGFISHLYFDIGSGITDLKVYRCATNDNPNEYLHVDGDSIFHGQAVRSWEGMYHEAELRLGPGVVFNLGSHIGQLGQLSETSSAISDFDRNKLHAHIEKMDRVKMEGSWWEDFRAPISAIVGILASAGKLASTGLVKMSAKGIFVQYKFIGYAISTATAASMSALSAGTAMLVAPGVAAAIYFIPWGSIFGWLNTVVSWLTTGLNKIWEKIKDWLASCASTIRDTLGLDGKLHGPLRFPA